MAIDRKTFNIAQQVRRLTRSEHGAARQMVFALLTFAFGLLIVVVVLRWGSGAGADAPHQGLNFYIAIDSPARGTATPPEALRTPYPKTNNVCDTDPGTQAPDTCNLSPGASFTVKVYLTDRGGIDYSGFDIVLNYSAGLTPQNIPSAAPWPDCGVPANVALPNLVKWTCALAIGAPASTYVGLIGVTDFTCAANGTLALVHGFSERTKLTDFDAGEAHAEGDVIIPLATLTNTPQGGNSLYTPSPTGGPVYSTPINVGNTSEALTFTGCGAAPTNTPTPTSTETGTATATNTATNTTVANTSTATSTATATPTATSLTPSATATACPTQGCPTPTSTVTSTSTATFTATATSTSTATATATFTSTPTRTSTATSTATATITNTSLPTSTPTQTATPSNTPTRTNTSPPPSTPTLPASPDLTVTKEESEDPIVAGRPIIYTIQVNNGGDAVANFVRLLDTPDSNFTYTGFSTSRGSCALVGPVTGGVLDCDLGSLENGSGGVAFIFVTGHFAAIYDHDVKNLAVVDPENTVHESNEANNSASAGTRLMLHTPTPPSGPGPDPSPTHPFMQGDTNGDGEIDSLDALGVLLLEAGLTHELAVQGAGDVNKDGLTNSLDALTILFFDAGLIHHFGPG